MAEAGGSGTGCRLEAAQEAYKRLAERVLRGEASGATKTAAPAAAVALAAGAAYDMAMLQSARKAAVRALGAGWAAACHALAAATSTYDFNDGTTLGPSCSCDYKTSTIDAGSGAST